MNIPLPWKTKGHDGREYRAVLRVNIEYGNTQREEIAKSWTKALLVERQGKAQQFAKKQKSGLRKCPGHKITGHYDDKGQCDKCGGFRRVDGVSG